MMLHEKQFTHLVIKQVTTYLKKYNEILGTDELYFNKKLGKYKGIKNHHGHPFLIEDFGKLVYIRGLGGKIILETFHKLKGKQFYGRKEYEGTTFKVRPKI